MAAHVSYLLERRARTFGRTELVAEEERIAALMLSITSQPCRSVPVLQEGLIWESSIVLTEQRMRWVPLTQDAGKQCLSCRMVQHVMCSTPSHARNH